MVHLVLPVFPETQETLVPLDLKGNPVSLVSPVFQDFPVIPVHPVHQDRKGLHVLMVLMHL